MSKLVPITKKEKAEANKRRKQSMEIEEEDEENRDWWTKYFSSLEAVAMVCKGEEEVVLCCNDILCVGKECIERIILMERMLIQFIEFSFFILLGILT